MSTYTHFKVDFKKSVHHLTVLECMRCDLYCSILQLPVPEANWNSCL